MLSDDIIYIVSGLERSGTSLMMQILEKANLWVIFFKKNIEEMPFILVFTRDNG